MNLLCVNEVHLLKQFPGIACPKPELYKELVSLISTPGLWVFDPLCGICNRYVHVHVHVYICTILSKPFNH